MLVCWHSLPLLEMETEGAALSQASSARTLERKDTFPTDPRGSETPQPSGPAGCVPRLLVNRAAGVWGAS